MFDSLERFLRYVRIDTQSADESETYPSTAKQLDLARLLAEELRALVWLRSNWTNTVM